MKPVTHDNIYDECVARGIPTHNHESDLYIPVTLETSDLLNHFGHRAETFTNQVEGGLWYDVPCQYKPFWDKVEEQSRKIQEAQGNQTP